MKNQALLLFTIFLNMGLFAQDIYYTKTGTIIFDGKTPFETIYAESNQVTSFLNTADGELNFAALIKSFQFKNELMGEHFNENYIESSIYPKAIFKGKIVNWTKIDLSKNEAQNVNVEGKLTIHGVTKDIKLEATLHPQKGNIVGICSFGVNPEEYGIRIPRIVRDKIAKVINVSINGSYEPFKQ